MLLWKIYVTSKLPNQHIIWLPNMGNDKALSEAIVSLDSVLQKPDFSHHYLKLHKHDKHVKVLYHTQKYAVISSLMFF